MAKGCSLNAFLGKEAKTWETFLFHPLPANNSVYFGCENKQKNGLECKINCCVGIDFLRQMFVLRMEEELHSQLEFYKSESGGRHERRREPEQEK